MALPSPSLPGNYAAGFARAKHGRTADGCGTRGTTFVAGAARCGRISPHTFRHSTVLHLLKSGVALEVITLLLGHQSPVTTHSYIEAGLTMKAKVLRSLESPSPLPNRVPAVARLSRSPARKTKPLESGGRPKSIAIASWRTARAGTDSSVDPLTGY
jgi:hypothetical protein